jgi:ribonuclease HI
VAVDGFEGMQYDSGFVPPPTTNNRMEMWAQIQALSSLHASYGPCEAEIVSDSQYVVLGCQQPTRARNANADTWAKLDEAIELHSHIQWRHVHGHIGVKWNELADQLAVKARKGATWQ